MARKHNPEKPTVKLEKLTAHLKDKYTPYDQREEGDWVVVYFNETDTCRLFPTLERVGLKYGFNVYTYNRKKTHPVVFVKYEQLAEWFTGARLVQIYNENRRRVARMEAEPGKIFAKHVEPLPDDAVNLPLEVARKVWSQLQLIGDKVTGISKIQNESGDSNQFSVRLDRMQAEEAADIISRFPKQARIICEQLIKAQTSFYTETEMMTFARDLVRSGAMKTKQDSWRVFMYYAPVLGDHGFMYYPGKKHKREDHTKNL